LVLELVGERVSDIDSYKVFERKNNLSHPKQFFVIPTSSPNLLTLSPSHPPRTSVSLLFILWICDFTVVYIVVDYCVSFTFKRFDIVLRVPPKFQPFVFDIVGTIVGRLGICEY
jgi:hypothetical protein